MNKAVSSNEMETSPSISFSPGRTCRLATLWALACLAALSSRSHGQSHLIEEDFEGAGAPGGWTASGTVDWDSAATPVAGSEQLRISSSTAYVEKSFASQSSVWVYLAHRAAWTPNSNKYVISLLDGSDNELTKIMIDDQDFEMYYSSDGSHLKTSTDLQVANQVAHLWYHFATGDGTNGIARLYVSSDPIRPIEPVLESAAATATTGVEKIRLAGSNNVSDQDFDDLIVSSTEIGADPWGRLGYRLDVTGLVAWWDLDEASGTRLDSHVNGLDLSDSNTVGSAEGPGGAGTVAADFTAASSESLSHLDDSLLDMATDQPWTIHFWIRQELADTNKGVINKGVWNARIHLQSNDRLNIRANLATDTVDGSAWHHFIGGWDGTEYWSRIDGGTRSISASATGAATPNSDAFTLGSGQWDGLDYFDGRLARVGLWKRTLTTQEQDVIYNGGGDFDYVDLTSAGGNTPPSVTPITHSSAIGEDEANAAADAGLSIGSDVDGDSLSITKINGNANLTSEQGSYGKLTLTDNGNDTFDYSYDLDDGTATVDGLTQGQAVQDVFTVSVSDGTVEAAFSLTFDISGANDAPVFNTASGIDSIPPATEGVAYDHTIATNQFSDADTGTNLTYELAGSPPSGFIFENTGRLHTNGQPVSSAAVAGSPYSLTINATDGTADSPGDAFSLAVSAASQGADTPVVLTSSGATSGSRIDLSGTDLIIENREADSFIRVLNAGSERFVIDPSGNFGLGTQVLDYKLNVAGTIRAEEVIVETGWSDFVFEEGYKLPSLDEVKLHIQDKGHLPGVPSAEFIQKEGLSLGESQALLMQKIEEMTLYLIEKEKQFQELQERNEALERRIQEIERNQNK